MFNISTLKKYNALKEVCVKLTLNRFIVFYIIDNFANKLLQILKFEEKIKNKILKIIKKM